MKPNENLVRHKLRVGLGVLFFSLSMVFPNIAQAQGCQTGAEVLANAHLRYNPIFAYYFGSFEQYVEQNRAHFVAGGDAVICAQRLSQALVQGAIQNYDPGDQQRRDQLNADLGAMGISPGQQYATRSQQMLAVAQQMDKFAYALPYAAEGNFGPLWTPRNETEQLQIFAMQMLRNMLQDPGTRSIFEQIRPQAIELGNIEYRMILALATGL